MIPAMGASTTGGQTSSAPSFNDSTSCFYRTARGGTNRLRPARLPGGPVPHRSVLHCPVPTARFPIGRFPVERERHRARTPDGSPVAPPPAG
ncbi:hypothetical protein GCM10010140_42330 [Streptosporangium pseudovulgare]|uniref:Uncharacterized protein n=1 Tax=Streptosporangium pseudovulgare TaxID=35765 RepID=A0ABQ2R0Q7_9ACTN|nr:hypothetical protein GCM10010140_42330 [Streptosporangium pseudovulgare]